MLRRSLPSCSPRALAAARILCAGDEAELAGRTADALGRWRDPVSPINEVREQTLRQECKKVDSASVSNIRGASALVTRHKVTSAQDVFCRYAGHYHLILLQVKALRMIAGVAFFVLSRFPKTLEQDKQLLAGQSLPDDLSLAVQLRLAKKQIMAQLLHDLASRIKVRLQPTAARHIVTHVPAQALSGPPE